VRDPGAQKRRAEGPVLGQEPIAGSRVEPHEGPRRPQAGAACESCTAGLFARNSFRRPPKIERMFAARSYPDQLSSTVNSPG
jgi:hypothetical protein